MNITHEEDNQSMLCEILEKNANEIPVILRPGTSKRKQTASMYISNEQAAKKISDSQMMSLTSPSLLELYNEEEFDDSEKDPDTRQKKREMMIIFQMIQCIEKNFHIKMEKTVMKGR